MDQVVLQIKKATRKHHQLCDKSLEGPTNAVSLNASLQGQSGDNRGSAYAGESGKSCESTEMYSKVPHPPQSVYRRI